MIDTLITSRTRIKLLTRFFLNADARAHLRGLETEFGESSNAIRIELNRFEKAGLLVSGWDGIKKMYQANTSHPLYKDIHSILLKHLGLDHIIQKVIEGLGDLRRVYMTGDYARGLDNGTVDLLLIGNDVDSDYLAGLIGKAEKLISRTVRYHVCAEVEEQQYLKDEQEENFLLLWESED